MDHHALVLTYVKGRCNGENDGEKEPPGRDGRVPESRESVTLQLGSKHADFSEMEGARAVLTISMSQSGC